MTKFVLRLNGMRGVELVLGFSKKELMALLEKAEIEDSQKDAIAEIIHRNNQRIEQELVFIIKQMLDEQARVLTDTYLH